MRPHLLLSGVLFILFASTAWAEERTLPPHLALQLTYRRGAETESCPSEQTLGHLLIGAFGYDPVTTLPGPGVTIKVQRRRGKFHAEVTIARVDGELLWAQELDDARCMPLMRNAVAVAYLEARHTLDPPAPSPPEAEESKAPAELPPLFPPPPLPALLPAPSRPSPTPALAAPAASPPPAVTFRLGLAALLRLLQQPADMGVTIFGEAQRGDLSLSLEGVLRTSLPPLNVATPSVQKQAFGGALAPCYHQRLFFGCLPVGAEGATLILQRDDGHVKTFAPWVAFTFGGRLGLEQDFGAHLGLRGFAEVGGNLARLPVRSERQEGPLLTGNLSLGLVITVRP